jgi:alpha-glucosidase (family GH31 glycosyl hydrolase)
MFAVDAPKQIANDPGSLQDLIRVVVSPDDSSSIDHPVLLADRLPVGTPVTGTLQNDYWNVTVTPQEQSVAFTTRDGRPLVNLRLQGDGPCTLTVDVAPGVQVWGLGQCFAPPDARVDWIGHRRQVDQCNVLRDFRPYGHGLQTYVGTDAEGYIQIPILLVAGGPQPFGIVLDYVYRIEADFSTSPWSIQLGSAVGGNPSFPVRMYVVGGATVVDVRRRVMDLVGRPPLPPRKAFGLWVSEYGFEDWDDVDRVRDGLRAGSFPLDGVVLDLYWFGGVGQPGVNHSDMGRLGWDITDDPGVDDPYFPDPQGKLAEYARDHVGIALIEESYVSTDTATFTQIQADVSNPFVRVGPSVLRFYNVWLGREAAMLDWTNPQVGDWVHRNRRKPFMVDYGVRVHWTDLGEPELFSPDASYHGTDLAGSGVLSMRHEDVANVYNLCWHRSIDRGYEQDGGDSDRRRLLLTRSGSAGIQRFGAAIWSGDTGGRMEVLVAHLHAQAHMSCSGIDYHGADVGGFRRELVPPGHLDELYTQWFANSAWFDVPLRPHVDNSSFYNNRVEGTLDSPQRHRVAPYEVGHLPSNLENLRTRYRLIPYYYSLAHLAAGTGTPILPPPGIVHPDVELRGIAHQKLVGDGLMVAVVAGHGEYARRVYLPSGTWYDFYSGERYPSRGEWFSFVPEYRGGLFRLPAFARGGAIIPMMHVDPDTLDSAGNRPDGSRFEDLILRVFDDPSTAGSFRVYEDDGTTRNSPSREILVEQRRVGDHLEVTVHGASRVVGLADVRPLVVEMVSAVAVSEVSVNGDALPNTAAASRSVRGWATIDTRTVRACLPDADVQQTQTFTFGIQGAAPIMTSVLLVCDRAFTDWGEDVYARFLQPVSTVRGQIQEVKLDPSLTYQYMYPQPPDAQRNCPMWTLHLDEVHPDQELRLIFEKRRDGSVIYSNPQLVYRSSGPGGYVGELRGSLY